MEGEARRPEKVVEKLTDARNESDPEIRRRLLTEVLAGNCTFTDSERRQVVGRGAISALFGEELLDPEHWVKQKGKVAPTGDRFAFRWLVSSSIARPRSELCWLELADDGRIGQLTVHHSVDASPSLGFQAFGWAREHPAPALAAVAGALYAVLRISMALFYNQFDITPEEAGFTNDEVLRQSATFIGVVLLYGLGLIAVNLLVAAPFARVRSVSERLSLMQEPGKGRFVRGLALAPSLVAVVALYLVLFIDGGTTPMLVALGVLLACIVVVPRLVLLLPLARHVIVLGDESVRRSHNLGLPRMLAAVGPLLGILLVSSLPLMAYLSADDVKNYGDSGGRLLPWRALPATVKWTTEKPLVKLSDGCKSLRLLGESDEKVFLFDLGVKATVRIPAEDVIVSTSDC